ncbi:MAG: hypothetical protein H0X59_02475, partial [Chloroflexi bacterium]|nr:hypothetical protein [Chloroflexota bacterium]
AKLTLSATSITVPAGGTGTFEVTLSARGAFTSGGDVTVSGGGHTYLVPFWYSTGNTGS